MSSIHFAEAFAPLGAALSKVEAIPVTTSSVIIDLSTRTNIYADLQAGRLMLADADGADVYFAFNSENSGSIDQTNTTAANATQCARVPAGALVPMRPPYHNQQEANQGGLSVGMYRYLLVRANIACTLRLSIVSEAPNKRS